MRIQRRSFASFGVLSSFRLTFRSAFGMILALAVFCLTNQAAHAQGTSLADPAGPRVIVPSQGTPQFLVLNANESLQGYSTLNSSSFTLNCPAPLGLSVASGTSLTLAVDARDLTVFQTGHTSIGPGALGRGAPYSGTVCSDSPSILAGANGTTAQFSAQDPAHEHLFVLAAGGTAPDTLTSFDTSNVLFNSTSNTLTKLGQANLDTAGTYTSVVADVDGANGDAIVTELRTDTSAGGLWFYNAITNFATRILGPGGVALPGINAFIIHNPNDGGGGLLVLVNQDGLTSSNITSPPTDSSPFTIIDLGQLHTLIGIHPTQASVTLPSLTTVTSSLGYYAMLGAAYNPVNHLLYAVVGGGTSLDSLYREVVSYDPSNPSSPAETVVADGSSIPLTSALNTQVALNAASGTMQILSKDAGSVYTLPISGTGGTATQLAGSTFADSSFQPTFIAANPLLGETYIASTSQVDIITRPTAKKMLLVLDLTAPESISATGDTDVHLFITAPYTSDAGLSTTSVTITATPQDGSAPFTFAAEAAAFAVGYNADIGGTFANPGIYTLVATFPGDSTYAPSTSSPVVIAVAKPLFATQISVTGQFNNSTGAGTAAVTLTGTTLTPSGTITITSGTTGTILAEYTLAAGAISNPIAIAFTGPPDTTTIKAGYSGDALNQASTSAAATLGTPTLVTPNITLTGPLTGAAGSPLHLNLAFTSSSKTAPQGNIQVSAVSSNSPFVLIATIPASQAFAAGGKSFDWTPTDTGTYAVKLYFDGDGTYNITSVNGPTIVITNSGAPTLTLTTTGTTVTGSPTHFNVDFVTTSKTAPTGNITLATGDGNTLTFLAGQIFANGGGNAQYTYNTAGTYNVVLSYAGDANYSPATSTTQVVITATKFPTTLTLYPSSPATTATPFNVGVGLASSGTATPTGNISLSAQMAGSASIFQGTASAAEAITAPVPLSVGVTVPGTYTLTATYPGDANFAASTGTVQVNVTGVGHLSLSPTELDFNVAANTTSSPQSITVTNSGSITLNAVHLNLQGVGFSETTNCPASLAPLAQCVIQVTFQPTSPQTILGSLSITTDSTTAQTVALDGVGLGATASLSTTNIAFANLTAGTIIVTPPNVTLTNTGNESLAISSITSSDAVDFELVNNTCLSKNPLAAGASCTVGVEFHPVAVGAHSATVQFVTADKVSPQTVTVAGNGIAFGTCPDADFDGLCDDWEKLGLKVQTSTGKQLIDLPAMGADPMHKDIFLHIDYMEMDPKIKGSHSHKPDPMAMAALQKVFNNSPALNPDKTTGIHLHIDAGSEYVMNPITLKTWGSLSKAVALPEQAVLDTDKFDPTKAVNFTWNIFDANSNAFNVSGRSLVFHHVIFAHDQLKGYTSSGISRNDPTTIASFLKGGSDLVVSLGSWTNSVGSTFEQTGTLMHELGHNLSLEHGGRDEFNHKPNHLSVMNYSFQTTGLLLDSAQVGTFDYSEFALPALDETNLSEVHGIAADPKIYLPTTKGGASLDRYGTDFYCNGDDITKILPRHANTIDDSINWGCFVPPAIVTAKVTSDTNGDKVYTTNLVSVEEWPLLVFSGGAVGGNGAAAPMQTPANEITMEQASLNTPLNGVTVTGMGVVQTAPGSTTSLRFTVKNTGLNSDTFNLTASSTLGWAAGTVSPATVTLAAGASAEVVVAYTIPPATADGTRDQLMVTATSQTAPTLLDNVLVALFATTSPDPFAVSTATVIFGSQATGVASATKAVVLTNTGTSALTLSSVVASAEFSSTNNCGNSLAVGTSCTISVAFTPAAEGVRPGTLTVTSSGSGDPLVVNLSGTGITVSTLPRPAVNLTVTPTSTSTGQTVTAVVKIPVVAGSPVATGIISFVDGTTPIGQATLDSTGTATFTTSTLAAGTYNLHAEFAGDTGYIAANSTNQTLTIVAATPTTAAVITSAPAIATGGSVTFTATIGGGSAGSQPTGNVSFFDGATLLGSGALNASGVATFTTTSLSTGTHSITASYGGDATFGASTSTAVQEVVGTFATTAVLTTTTSPVIFGASVTLTATVSSGTGTPTGTVTFFDGSTTLGTGTLNSSGVATFSTTTLAIGTHSITAQYAATGNYGASVSAAKQIVVAGVPDYSIAGNPTSLTITSGSSGTVTFTVTPTNSYAGTINFSCGTLPANASCAFAPAKLTFAATAQTPQTTTLTVNTTQTQTALNRLASWNGSPVAFALMLPLALFGFARRRRNPFGAGLLLLVLSAAGLLAITGCGNSAPAVTPAGTYSVPITITDGTTNHSLTYSITVK